MEGVEEAEKLRRFIHYYERYKTHKENLQVCILHTHTQPGT